MKMIITQADENPANLTFIVPTRKITDARTLFNYGVKHFGFECDDNYQAAKRILASDGPITDSFAISDPLQSITMWYPQDKTVGFRFQHRPDEAARFIKRFPLSYLVCVGEEIVIVKDERTHDVMAKLHPILTQFNKKHWMAVGYQYQYYIAFKNKDDAMLFKLSN